MSRYLSDSNQFPIAIDLGAYQSKFTPFSKVVSGAMASIESRWTDSGGSILSMVGRVNRSEVIVGDRAHRYQLLHPSSVVSRVPDRIRASDDQVCSGDLQRNRDTVQRCDGDFDFHLESRPVSYLELLVDLLVAIRHETERKNPADEITAWIAVHSFLSRSERQSIALAAHLAGFSEVHLVLSSAALSMSVFRSASPEDSSGVCIIDLGWGQAKLVCVRLERGKVAIIQEETISELGGYFWDRCLEKILMDHAIEQTGLNLRTNEFATSRIRDAVENCRLALTDSEEHQIYLPYIMADESGPKHVDIKIDRSTFESAIAALVMKMMDAVQSLCDRANYSIKDGREVVLMGGFSHLPIVRKQFAQRFHTEPRLPSDAEGGVLRGLVEIAQLSLIPSTEERQSLPIVFENESENSTCEMVEFMDAKELLETMDADELESIRLRLQRQESEHEESQEVAQRIAENRKVIASIEAWLSESSDLLVGERRSLESIVAIAKKAEERNELGSLRSVAQDIESGVEQLPEEIRSMFRTRVVPVFCRSDDSDDERCPKPGEEDPEPKSIERDITQNKSSDELGEDVRVNTSEEASTSPEG